MHKALITFSLLLLQYFSYSQTRAVTDKGEEVILNNDGTWKYANITPSYNTRLDTPVMKKSTDATFLVKGQTVKYGVYIDPKKWTFKSEKQEGSSQEYTFSLKNEDAYAMVISERMELTQELVKSAAVENAKSVAPDVHITREETRKVNNQIVWLMEMQGTIQGVPFVYIGYYYVGKVGTIQFIAYTTQSLLKQYKAEMETLLNGLVLLD